MRFPLTLGRPPFAALSPLRCAARAAAGGLALVALGLPATAQAATPAPWLVRAADADGNGEITAAEWGSFTEALPRQADALDRSVLLVRAMYDRIDADGVVRAADLERIRAAFDPDGNGVLEGSEAPTRGNPRDTTPEDRFLGFLLLGAADVDGNGVVDPAEWSTLVATAGDPVSDARLGSWFATAMANVAPGDRNAMGPGVTLLTFDAALDADQDGQVTGADLRLHFSTFDADQSGVVTASELQAQRTPGFDPSRWSIRDELRDAAPAMPWQRNLEDALALSKSTGKPLLLCVNMDGETASETLALDRYRDPRFVDLARGFVPLIVSPDRRNPRDYDDRGRRIEDPRFGRVINQEAIDGEPALYERYFEGRRVAPRHVGVSPDGEILFDLYLLQDLSVIDRALEKHGVPGEIPAAEDLPLRQLLGSHDAGHRAYLERRFLDLGVVERATLAAASLTGKHGTTHPELLRLALADPHATVRQAAVEALIADPGAAPLDAFVMARRLTHDRPGQGERLAAALEERRGTLAAEADRARADRLAEMMRRFDAPFPAGFGTARWARALRIAPPGPGAPAGGPEDFAQLVALMEEALAAADAAPGDAVLRTQAAAVQLRFALRTLADGGNPQFLFDDAQASARRAVELDPDCGRAQGLLARASYMMGDTETTLAAARRALPALELEATDDLVLQVLEAHVKTLLRDVYAALNAGEPLPGEALTEARAAYEILVRHPGATEEQTVAYLTFLGTLEAYGEQRVAVEEALERAPASPTLHNYLRFCLLRDEGAAALESVYDERLSRVDPGGEAAEQWFAGLASLVAAERRVENQDVPGALASYRASNERFRRSMELQAEFTGSASHYMALARAGRARLHADQERWDEAVGDLVASVVASPASADTADGLGNTPAATARVVRRNLRRAGEDELVRRLVEAMAERGVKGFEPARPEPASAPAAPAPPPEVQEEKLEGTPLGAFRSKIGFDEPGRWMTFDVVPSAVTETRRRIFADKLAVTEALLAHRGGEGFEAAPMEYPAGTVFVAESLTEDGRRLDTEVLVVGAGGLPEFKLFGPAGEESDTFAQPGDPATGPTPGNVPRACLGCHLGNNYFEPMMSFPAEGGERAVQVDSRSRDLELNQRFLEGYHRGSSLFGSYGAMLLSSLRSGTLDEVDKGLLERLKPSFPGVFAGN